MESTSFNVRDINSDERRIYEAALGQKLQENQKIILQVITLGAESPAPAETEEQAKQPSGQLPDWCNVYEGLSDEEVDEIESVILDRSGWNRDSQ
jgi:hypothetical protein